MQASFNRAMLLWLSLALRRAWHRGTALAAGRIPPLSSPRGPRP